MNGRALSIALAAALGTGLAAWSVGTAGAAEALTFPQGQSSGIAGSSEGGIGWEFVPRVKVILTRVGYLYFGAGGGNPNAVVTIWSGTNTPLAAYTGLTNGTAANGDLVHTDITPLELAAGQRYAITLHSAPLTNSVCDVALFDNAGVIGFSPFDLAPDLDQYGGLQLDRNGVFSPLYPDPTINQQLLLLGPTFSYEPPFRPTLNLQRNPLLTVTWPTNAVGFVLQSSPSLNGTFLTLTNVPAVVGTNFSQTLPAANATEFFRLMKPN